MRSLNSGGAELDQGRFHDFSLAELSAEMRNRLEVCHEPNWFSSMGFAEYYCFPPAERVSFVENASGETTEKCFYRERKWAGMFRELELCGPIDPRNSLLGELLLRHRVSAAHVQWVAAADLPEWKATLDAVRTERIGEDSCIELPKSCSEYLQRLGRKTRKHLPYYVRRLQREWGEEWAFEQSLWSGDFKGILRSPVRPELPALESEGYQSRLDTRAARAPLEVRQGLRIAL